jgi:hypothetical protein
MRDSRFQCYQFTLNTPRKDGFFPYLLSRCFAEETGERLSAGKPLRYVHDRATTAERRRMLGR